MLFFFSHISFSLSSEMVIFFCYYWSEITSLHLFLSFYFSIKWSFHTYLGFNLFFRVFIIILLRRLLVCGQFERQNIFDQIETTNQIMIIKMLYNWNHSYSSHYSTIKCVGFESIHYVINLDVVSPFVVFR